MFKQPDKVNRPPKYKTAQITIPTSAGITSPRNVLFTKLFNRVVMHFDSSSFPLPSNSNYMRFFGVIPIEFRPKSNTSIIHSFGYADGTDWMLTVTTAGDIISNVRDINTGRQYATGYNYMRTNAITYVVQDV